jgi:hypothetical protein
MNGTPEPATGIFGKIGSLVGGRRRSRRQGRQSRREETAPMRKRQHKGGKSRRTYRKRQERK